MNIISESTVFAVVLAVNLLLAGAVVTAGSTLIFKFAENISPRIRYCAAIIIFSTAILLPLYATLARKTYTHERADSQIIAETDYRADALNFTSRDNLSTPQNNNINFLTTGESSVETLFSQFISSISSSSFATTFLIIWILGIFLLFGREAFGLWQLKKARKSWTPIPDAEREILQVPEKVRIYFAENQSPGTTGLFRPTIVLPKKFPAQITLQSKRCILQHEMAHVRRYDPLQSFLVRTIKNLFWVSPALWLIESLIDREREAAADQAVIDRLSTTGDSKTKNLRYAQALLLIGRAFKEAECENDLPQLIGIGSGGELESRVRRLLTAQRVSYQQMMAALCACFLTVLFSAVIPLAAFSAINTNSQLNLNMTKTKRKNLAAEAENHSRPAQSNTASLSVFKESQGNQQNPANDYLRKSASNDSVMFETSPASGSEKTENQNLKSAGNKESVEISDGFLSSNETGVTEFGKGGEVSELTGGQPPPATSSTDSRFDPKLTQIPRPAVGNKNTSSNESDSLFEGKTAADVADDWLSYSLIRPATSAIPKSEMSIKTFSPPPAKKN